MTVRSRLAPLAVLLLGATACDDSGLTAPAAETPAAGSPLQFSQALTLPELQQGVASQATRVEIKLRSATSPLVAREVERQDSAAAHEPEAIESRVTAVEEGALVLEIGGLRVGFDAATRFQAEGGDSLSRDAFVARLQEVLAAGGRPAVEAERPAPAAPQDPDDASFLASRLELDDEASEPKLELNVDADNLLVDSIAASPALLKVLGLSIELRPRETELRGSRPEHRKKAKFEGVAAAADPAAGTVTLVDGRVIRVVAGTEIEQGKKGEKLGSVAAVAAALAAGQIVEAEGKGLLESESPRTIVAVEVEFEVESEAENVPQHRRLEGRVAGVDLQRQTLTLADSQVIRLVAGTRIIGKGKHQLGTLQQVVDALAAQRTVSVMAHVLLDSAGPPASYVALQLKLEAGEDRGRGKAEEDREELVRFESRVAAIDLTAGTLTLADSSVVRITQGTTVEPTGKLRTLQQVADAVAAKQSIRVKGEGTLEAAGPPRVLVAGKVRFQREGDD